MNADNISIDTPCLYRTHRTFTVNFFGIRIITSVAHRAVAVRKWLFFIRRKYNLHPLIVGLGVQWRPKSHRGEPEPRPAVMQLCVGNQCLIFQLCRATSIPMVLRRFLSNPNITFVGVGNKLDCRKLKLLGLDVEKGREIRDLVKRRNVSMETLALEVLGYAGVKKTIRIGRSSWNARKLSKKQVQYAAVDAYIALRLGLHLLV